MTKEIITVRAEDQLKEISRFCVDIIPEKGFFDQLKKSYETQVPLKIKFGADPSRPDIHLGHTVILQVLRLFQDFGHHVQFIIGDFTARIGDPSGKSQTRPMLTEEEVKGYAKTYAEQVFKVLDPKKTSIHYNYDWLSKFNAQSFLEMMSKVTVSSVLERDDFSKRFKTQEAIYLHEFMYPMMQGFDSVELRSDIEVGGTDQTFNLLMGRYLQKQYNVKEQSVLTFALLEGTDGVKKMSKSYDNYISLEDSPADMFGKLMSISDDLMKKYYRMLVRKNADEIEALLKSVEEGSYHPMQAKKDLAKEITSYYHGIEKASQELKAFENRFSKNVIPDDLPEYKCSQGEHDVLSILTELDFIKSRGEGRRLLKQNAFKLDGKAYKEEKIVFPSDGSEHIIKLGKLRMAKIRVTS